MYGNFRFQLLLSFSVKKEKKKVTHFPSELHFIQQPTYFRRAVLTFSCASLTFSTNLMPVNYTERLQPASKQKASRTLNLINGHHFRSSSSCSVSVFGSTLTVRHLFNRKTEKAVISKLLRSDQWLVNNRVSTPCQPHSDLFHCVQ